MHVTLERALPDAEQWRLYAPSPCCSREHEVLQGMNASPKLIEFLRVLSLELAEVTPCFCKELEHTLFSQGGCVSRHDELRVVDSNYARRLMRPTGPPGPCHPQQMSMTRHAATYRVMHNQEQSE